MKEYEILNKEERLEHIDSLLTRLNTYYEADMLADVNELEDWRKIISSLVSLKMLVKEGRMPESGYTIHELTTLRIAKAYMEEKEERVLKEGLEIMYETLEEDEEYE